MKKTYLKMLFMGVKKSSARFISILAIVAVGVGFLGGLMATTPDMQLTVDNYYAENNMYDISIKGTLGLTDEDAAEIEKLEYVKNVMPAYVTDLNMETESGNYVTRIYGVPLNERGQDTFLNNFELIEGRMPENPGECLIMFPNGYANTHNLNEVFTISEDNKDYESRSDTYAFESLTAVGIVKSPHYMSIEEEPSTVGNGSVGLIMYVFEEAYNLDVYTDIFVTLNGVENMNSFSDSYFEKIDEITDELEQFGTVRSQIRYDDIKAEAQAEIDDAWAEYNDAKAEAETELNDARKELDDAKAEIEDGRAEIEDKKKELADGEKQLEDARAEIADGEAQINENRQKLEDGRAELEAQKSEAAAAEAEIADKRNELTAAENQLNAAEATLNAEIAKAREDAEAVKGLLTEEQYAQMIAEIDKQESEGRAQIESNRSVINSGKAELAAAENQLAEGNRQIAAAEKTISDGEAELVSAEAELEEAKQKLADSEKEIADGKVQLADAEAELADGEKELADGEKEYADAKADAEKELADAEAEIKDAEAELDELKAPEWYITDRRDIVSFASYKSNSEKINAIAKVFPVFFFLVAALVALTTMTRMVEEERTQIGTLKALGYSNGIIAAYYVGYSVFASLIGGIVGIVIGFKLFPTVISNAYSMMYIQPPLETVFWWNYAVIIILIAIACTTAATLFACVEQLSEKPASLMLPRAPKAGKRILLERIGFIWSRMKFTHKVTARNIFRYKKRFFMTVFGIAGCCALLVTGFGLRDSIGDIVNKQFNELYKYNLLLYLENDGDAQNDKIVNDFLNNSNYVESYAEIHSESGYIESDGESKSVEIYVPKNTSQLTEQINLRIRKTGEPVPFDDDSLVLTEKLCETLGIKIGDTVTVRNIDGENSEFTVSGITENYVTAYAFMSESVYREIFGKAPEYSNVLITLTDEADEMRDDISSQLLESDNVMYIQFSSAIEESFTNSLKKIDYIVVVLILAAGALAVIVMYNLTNINICERKKELATIKVLGFHEGEVASYIYRETAILSIIGTLAGFVLGIFLHKFVIAASEVDMIMFGREIYPLSYVFSAAVTLMFTVIVDLIMLRKLNSIDMVESMKANE